MSDRTAKQDRFIAKSRWRNWTKHPLAVDASSRSYTRLISVDQSVIVMDAPPEKGEQTGPFVEIANYLVQCGLAAPKILEQDSGQGFLVLEDLGSDDFAQILRETPSKEYDLYTAATDVLIHLREQTQPKLTQMTPEVAGDMVRIVAEFYVQSPALADDLAAEIITAMQQLCGPPCIVALRDYHAENLIWREDKKGLARVGLLDFQDAFIAPDCYDLASLLRDARRDIDRTDARKIIDYFADQTNQPKQQVSDAVSCLSVQRNLRILGVFARLIRVNSKNRYAAMLPRIWDYITHDLQHPALEKLQGLVSKGIPEPTHPSITKWAK